MRERSYLFASGDLSASIEGHRQKMQRQIHALSPNQLLPAEDATVCQHFIADFTINPVEIQEEHIVLIEPREIEIAGPSDFGGTYRKKHLESRFEILFNGDSVLLSGKPSTYGLKPPCATVERNTNLRLVFVRELLLLDRNRPSKPLNDAQLGGYFFVRMMPCGSETL